MLDKPRLPQITGRGYWNHPRYRHCISHWMLSEGGGLETYDLARTLAPVKTRGTLVGGVAWSAGQWGPALKFDGTNDFFYIESQTPLTASLTYALWAKPVGTGIRKMMGSPTAGNGIFLSTGNLVYGVISSSTTITSVGTIPNSVWSHVALTWDGTNSRIYLNGKLDNSSATLTRFNVALIGRDNDGPGADMFEGWLDEIRVYTRALNEAEIWSLYNDPFLEFRQPLRQRLNKSTYVLRTLATLGVGR